ncbi:helix-turn-helix transcriptional regulator [Rhodococcus sp. CX]|uniref:helix-turn-helix domain-containing protein n=1 Tax=Rhodococcus sp. CX TaxID=2789880 RepID=UPI0018CC8AB7|nr:helix-turn-helix transcriptional regulator [Rhodococcus sp. CX]MBH0121525.1 helix-turn-helix transcriptional regulator [Rhodococcus sp. CX]
MHEFKRFIQQQLDARGWKQADLVRASGLSRSHVSKLIRDNREHLGQMPDDDTIAGLSRGFNVPEDVVRTAASRALVGYEDDGRPIHLDLTEVSTDALLQEVRRRIEETGARHGTGTAQEQKPRTEAGGTKHRSSSGSDRGRSGAPMKRGKVARLPRKNQGTDLDPSSGPGAVHVAGDRMPPPDQLGPEDILAAHTSDDPSGMYPDDTDN